MSQHNSDKQIRHLQKVLREWDLHSFNIENVRYLEDEAAIGFPAQLSSGYYPDQALKGYHTLVDAYKALNEEAMTPAQSGKIDNVLRILSALESDYHDLEACRADSHKMEGFAIRKMRELRKPGDAIYLLSGYRGNTENSGHFNITKITQTEKGYTYTLFDSGAESHLVKYENNQPVCNALQENEVKPGVNITQLIEAVIEKKFDIGRGDQYAYVKGQISKMLAPKPIRAVTDWGQHKANCTTRGQRILLADELQGTGLAEKIHNFVRDNESPGNRNIDIRAQLEAKLHDLQMLPSMVPQGRAMTTATLDKVTNKRYFQYTTIDAKDGAKLKVIRTNPKDFTLDELKDMQSTLQHGKCSSFIEESNPGSGQFILYIRPENTARYIEIMEAARERHYTEAQKATIQATEMDMEGFKIASHPFNYNTVRKTVDGRETLIYRTTPGMLTLKQLHEMQMTLLRNKVYGTKIEENTEMPGQYYLYTSHEGAGEILSALARDNSRPAEAYRQYGPQATASHVEALTHMHKPQQEASPSDKGATAEDAVPQIRINSQVIQPKKPPEPAPLTAKHKPRARDSEASGNYRH